MTPATFLVLNVALAFYNVGTIWAHQVDIFRTWRLTNPRNFAAVQAFILLAWMLQVGEWPRSK